MELENPNARQLLESEKEFARQISLQIPEKGHIHDVVLGTTSKVKIVAGFVYVNGELNESGVLAFGREPVQNLNLGLIKFVSKLHNSFKNQYLNYHLIGASLSNSRIKNCPSLAKVPHRLFEVGAGQTNKGIGQLMFEVHEMIDGLLDREITNVISMQAFFIKNGYWPKKIHFITDIDQNGDKQIQTIDLNPTGAQIIAQMVRHFSQQFTGAQLPIENPFSGQKQRYFGHQLFTPFYMQFDRNTPEVSPPLKVDSHFLNLVQDGIYTIMLEQIRALETFEKFRPLQAHPAFVFYSRDILGDLNWVQKHLSGFILFGLWLKNLISSSLAKSPKPAAD